MTGEFVHRTVGPELTQEEFESAILHEIDGVPAGTVIAGKVDKIPGKKLSTEDYTTAEKNKLAGIPSGGGSGALPDGVNTGDTVRYNADLGCWETKAEPLEFKQIVLTPALAAILDKEGGLWYKSTDKSVYVCTDDI